MGLTNWKNAPKENMSNNTSNAQDEKAVQDNILHHGL